VKPDEVSEPIRTCEGIVRHLSNAQLSDRIGEETVGVQVESSEMLAESADLVSDQVIGELPLDVHAGIEWLAKHSIASRLEIETEVIGQPALVERLTRYGAVRAGSSMLLAVNASPQELRAAVEQRRPQCVVTLGCGRLAEILAPVRRQPIALIPHMADSEWSSLGYTLTASSGFFGPGSMMLVLFERVANLIARPDWADRIRVARLNSAAAWHRTPSVSTVLLREYRVVG
jgi:hypothetical protein